MELFLVPVSLWLLASFVSTSAALKKLPICPPPAPISCTFPTHPRCIFDDSTRQDQWLCENIFTGTLKRPPVKKSFIHGEPAKNTELSNTLGQYSAKKYKQTAGRNRKKPQAAQSTTVYPEIRLRETLDSSDSKFHGNAMSNDLSASVPVDFYEQKPYVPTYAQPSHNYNSILSPYNLNYSPALLYDGYYSG